MLFPFLFFLLGRAAHGKGRTYGATAPSPFSLLLLRSTERLAKKDFPSPLSPSPEIFFFFPFLLESRPRMC